MHKKDNVMSKKIIHNLKAQGAVHFPHLNSTIHSRLINLLFNLPNVKVDII